MVKWYAKYRYFRKHCTNQYVTPISNELILYNGVTRHAFDSYITLNKTKRSKEQQFV